MPVVRLGAFVHLGHRHKRSDIEGRQVELSKYLRLQREASWRAAVYADPEMTLRELFPLH